MKPILALDMDDLLFPFITEFSRTINETHGTSFQLEDYVMFDYWEVWGCTREEAFDRVARVQLQFLNVVENHAPIDGSQAGVAELAEHFRLFVVTSRPDEYREHTHIWLKHHFPDVIEDVVLCNSYALDGREVHPKVDVVESLDAVGLVDDSLAHIRDVANTGRRALLFGDYAWNKTRDSMPASVQYASQWPEAVTTVKDWI